ncbi:hypothetical protein LWI28_009757 [Acer negundo]|uniref:P-type ATPase A domain-containing protein n=1 Tax=Acer negundo TaxID=4023 RepID=A0AAD5IV33_ACENE|nr:hypothetical protein LWI28_009757 [Acer negundo]
MFHSNTNGEGFDTDGSTLAAGLLTSAAILSDDPGYQWRRGITAYITACIAASRFISFKETTYYYEINNSFSSRSSRDEETSSSSCDRVSESPVNLSTLSQVSIDIPSDNEAEEKNEDEQLLLRKKAAQIVEERDQISLVINMSTDNEAEEKNEEQLLLRNKAAQIVEERDQISLVINRSSDNEVEENNGEQPRLRNEVAQIVKERDLISLKDFGGVEKVASIFDSHLESGIRSSIQEPEVRNSYRDSNPIHTKEFVFSLLKAGNNYTIFLLVVSAGLSFGTEIMEEGPKYGWHDGVVILAAVSMLIAFPSVANFLRTRKLEKERNKLNVKVVRRQEQDITISNLVPGDVVCLKKGDLVPADGLVVNSDGLELDGVLNSKIDHDRNPFLFFGSKVKEGHGKMLATSVGDQTELAELLSSAIQDPIEKTLLEDQIEKINTYVENLSLLVSIFIASVAFIRLLCRRHVGVVDNELPELKGKVSVDMLMKIFEKIVLKPHGKASILASALTVVVIAIQHGMPFVITISLSFWNSKMVKNQAGPQNFSACATMGIVTVMCIDVTGGLVCKDLEVNKFWIGGKDLKDDTDSEIDPPEPQIKTAVKAFKKAGVRIKLVSEEELPATLFSRRRPQPYLLSIGIPFSVFIFFTVSYNYNPFIGKTLR